MPDLTGHPSRTTDVSEMVHELQHLTDTEREADLQAVLAAVRTEQRPSIGRIVLVPMDPVKNNGADVAPAVITRVWSDTAVNVRVIADSHDVERRTSLIRVDELPRWSPSGPMHVWAWPERV